MSENIKEIIEKIEYYNGEGFPKEELQILIDNKEESTSYLLDSIRNTEECLNKLWEESDYILPFYALFLLAQFREKEAYSLMYELFSADAEMVDNVWGELITEDLGVLLASVCDGEVTLLNKLIEDDEVNEYVSSATMDSLICLLKEGSLSREEIISYYEKLLKQDWEEESFLCASLIGNCLDIRADELLPEIEKRFEANQVDEGLIGNWMVVQKEFVAEESYFNYETRDNYYLVSDAISEMEGWAYFKDEDEKSITPDYLEELFRELNIDENDLEKIRRSRQKELSKPQENIVWDSNREGTFKREIPKVGNNEPCPCGSGRKYKKCCINL